MVLLKLQSKSTRVCHEKLLVSCLFSSSSKLGWYAQSKYGSLVMRSKLGSYLICAAVQEQTWKRNLKLNRATWQLWPTTAYLLTVIRKLSSLPWVHRQPGRTIGDRSLWLRAGLMHHEDSRQLRLLNFFPKTYHTVAENYWEWDMVINCWSSQQSFST